jgi:mannose-6-phosphate isomerase-like protein (cupin superfamily)
MVGQRILVPFIEVRVLAPQHEQSEVMGCKDSNREEGRRNGSFSVEEGSEALETEWFPKRSEASIEIPYTPSNKLYLTNMNYKLIKNTEILKKKKFGINIEVYPNIGNQGFVLVDTEDGHNQEFYDKESTFNYFVLEGEGIFYLNDKDFIVSKGDCILISPNTRIYYKGKMRLLLLTNPAWKPENEVETRPTIW